MDQATNSARVGQLVSFMWLRGLSLSAIDGILARAKTVTELEAAAFATPVIRAWKANKRKLAHAA